MLIRVVVGIWVIVLAATASGQSKLGELQAVAGRQHQYRLLIAGKPTGLVVTSISREKPWLDIERSPNGIIYGTIRSSGSGAYTMFRTDAFVISRSHLKHVAGCEVRQRLGERILFVPVQESPWVKPLRAFLFDGKLVDLGIAMDAMLQKDGSVTGYYICDSKGMPLEDVADRSSWWQQHFVWRKGVRKLTKLVED